MVLLQSFDHFEVICMVNKGIDYRWKVVIDLLFTKNIDNFFMFILVEVSQKIVCARNRKQIVLPSGHFHGLYFYWS